MTATPETITTATTADKPHLWLAGLQQQGGYAYANAKAGSTTEALEHLAAIERLIAVYRAAVPSDTADTLAAWLYRRFDKSAVTWDALDQDDRTFWEHEADAVRRAVARGGFKEGE